VLDVMLFIQICLLSLGGTKGLWSCTHKLHNMHACEQIASRFPCGFVWSTALMTCSDFHQHETLLKVTLWLSGLLSCFMM